MHKLAQAAVTPFLKAAFRRRLLEIRAQNEQTIDRHSIDKALDGGFDAAAVEKARAKVKDFRAWIAAHKDELTALQVLYSGTKPLKLSLKDLRQLKNSLSVPPMATTPVQLWRAFQLSDPPAPELKEPAAVGSVPPGETLTDLVQLVRHALQPADPLKPYGAQVIARYRDWLRQKDKDGVSFTSEQRLWLDHMAEHIATSLAIEAEDFQDGWFGQHGSLGKAHQVFGEKLWPLLSEMNERLAA